MTGHTISVEWDAIPEDADDSAILAGGFRRYRCACGKPLDERVTAELHAMETDQCSVCLGSAAEEPVPGFRRPCTACAGSGKRSRELMWQVAYARAEEAISLGMVRRIVAGMPEPFALSEVADTVRALLALPAGQLPVGPRVRELLQRLEAGGEILMVSAPDELLRGASVVLYRDPSWRRATADTAGDQG